MSYFSLDKITFPAQENDVNTWADYLEICCLLSDSKSQTIDQLKDRLLDQFDMDFKKAFKALSVQSTIAGLFMSPLLEVDDLEIEEMNIEGEIEEEYGEVIIRGAESELSDKLQSEFLFLFSFLKARSALYGDYYPFQITKNKIVLNDNRNPHQNLYLALLCSALLRIYSPANMNKLGHLFEELTFSIFRKLVPEQAELHYFGTGAEKGDTIFKGVFYDRIIKLGECINTNVRTEFIENAHDYQHNGDGGLDWVGWYNFNDKCSKIPLYFAQCACGENWLDKEMDAHEAKWNNNLQFNDRPLLFHFISKSFRKSNGQWYKPGELHFAIILIDRLRILKTITEEDVTQNLALYNDLLTEALNFNMPSVDL